MRILLPGSFLMKIYPLWFFVDRERFYSHRSSLEENFLVRVKLVERYGFSYYLD